MNETPKPQPRPAFAQWMFERSLKLREAGDALGCSAETVRRMCLPFGDPGRRIPDETMMGRVLEYTSGAITASDWYQPALNGRLPADYEAAP